MPGVKQISGLTAGINSYRQLRYAVSIHTRKFFRPSPMPEKPSAWVLLVFNNMKILYEGAAKPRHGLCKNRQLLLPRNYCLPLPAIKAFVFSKPPFL